MEDDPFLTELLVAELKNTGFEIAVAKTGKEGVLNFQNFRPDCIVLDIMLPDQNGFDALREIRRSQEGRNVKVVVLSNVAEGANIEEARRLGVSEYLVKVNFSLPEIAEKIRGVLERK